MQAIEQLKKIVKDAEEEPIQKPMDLALEVQSYAEDIQRELNMVNASYGRFFISQNKNISNQLHLHSPKYAGKIHDHGTWGIMMSLVGTFALEDWMVNTSEGNHLIRQYLLPQFGLVHFPYLAGLDWHKNTNMEKFRAMSLHIYGPNYNNDESRTYTPLTDTIDRHQGMKMADVKTILA